MSASESPPIQSFACYREVQAKTVTRLAGIVDPWFLGRYGMNLYRGCEHGCAYCDGRAERYRVDGDFERDIVVKRNAAELLRAELRRIREPGFVFMGGGVSDSYQPAEARYQLARGALRVALDAGLAVHVLTKSTLVERDLDLLVEIQSRSRAIVSMSIQTVDDRIRQTFEPGASSVDDRWRVLEHARRLGVATGLMAVPVLPGLSDTPEAIGALLARAADVGVNFVCFGGLTLRPGVQKEFFLRRVAEHNSDLVEKYRRVYAVEKSTGTADPRYYARVDRRFAEALVRYGLPGRIPHPVFHGMMPYYSEVAVLLEHSEFESRRSGRPQPGLSRAAMAIQQWARSRLARHARVKGYDYRQVQHEFRLMVQEERAPALEGMTQAGWTEAQRIAQRIEVRP
jgi:DNA repair photolyase